jgi:hypothetical protein
MAQPRSKTRKLRAKSRRPTVRDVQAAWHSKISKSAKQLRRTEADSRVPEMPEERAKLNARKVGEDFAIAVSPTGTDHRPRRRVTPRLARPRAKAPVVGKPKSVKV